MDKLINDFLLNLKFGQVQVFKNMAVIPIFSKANSGPQYLTLKEAMDTGVLTITEIDSAGSVPELKAINKGKMPVLILDGEEIIGAKQNRVLNTTVLLKEESETIIPVSCTEQGRWHKTSAKFSDSDMVIAHKVRLHKNISVDKSLNLNKTFESDQGRVWNKIDDYQKAAETKSSTKAMRDVFEHKKESLDDYLKNFKFNSGQNGIFVFLQGKVTGFDYISLSSAYESLHLKLVKSYAMDAVLQKDNKDYNASEEKAKELIEKLNNSNLKKFDSVGYGRDYRFEGKGVIGSSLVWQDNIIHMACFKIDDFD
ncbi:ARPP-1 family domain-containing protein, partial [Actinomycetota bacterium]